MSALMLAPHVRACVDADCVIFLNLKRDRYLGARLDDVAQVVGEVRGLPHELKQAPTPDAARSAAVLAQLAASNLIFSARPAEIEGQAARGTPRPDRSILPDAPIPPQFIDAPQMLAACVFAAWLLKRRRLDVAAAVLEKRKRRTRRHPAPRNITADVARFLALRPFFPRRRVCLFDSLALMHFLTGRGHAPDLVIAARARPFAAHCWIEADRAILNDRLDNCRWFSPLLKV